MVDKIGTSCLWMVDPSLPPPPACPRTLSAVGKVEPILGHHSMALKWPPAESESFLIHHSAFWICYRFSFYHSVAPRFALPVYF